MYKLLFLNNLIMWTEGWLIYQQGSSRHYKHIFRYRTKIYNFIIIYFIKDLIYCKYFQKLTLLQVRRHEKQNWCRQESVNDLFLHVPRHIAQFGGGEPVRLSGRGLLSSLLMLLGLAPELSSWAADKASMASHLWIYIGIDLLKHYFWNMFWSKWL